MIGKLYAILLILAAIGAINWGLVGAFDINLVQELAKLVHFEQLQKIVYILVGLAGVYALLNGVERLAAD
jgi:uncharacterized membrane protein YuzA (DUF378 family)